MPAPLSLDLRRRILSAFEEGQSSSSEIAKQLRVSPTTVWRVINRHKCHGTVEAMPHGGGRKALIAAKHEHRVQRLIEKKPDATTEELACTYSKRWKTKVSRASMGRALARMNLTCKKKPSAR